MVAVAAACLPIFFTGHVIARWEGALFLLYYVLYTALIVFSARMPAHAGTFTNVLLMSAIPLTVLGLAASLVRHLRQGDVPEE
ncbi:MAG: sodium:calcium antiporter, partial [Planctomycetaceae bacterium]